MAAKTFNQKHEGGWREIDKSNLPEKSGVYCVYECTYNKTTDSLDNLKLIYI